MYANMYANIYMQSLPDGVQTCEQQQTGAQPNLMRVMKIQQHNIDFLNIKLGQCLYVPVCVYVGCLRHRNQEMTAFMCEQFLSKQRGGVSGDEL